LLKVFLIITRRTIFWEAQAYTNTRAFENKLSNEVSIKKTKSNLLKVFLMIASRQFFEKTSFLKKIKLGNFAQSIFNDWRGAQFFEKRKCI